VKLIVNIPIKIKNKKKVSCRQTDRLSKDYSITDARSDALNCRPPKVTTQAHITITEHG